MYIFFTFWCISSLSLAFREIIGDIHYIHTHKHAHISFHLWHLTSSSREYILFFLVAFVKHRQDRKSNSLVDIKSGKNIPQQSYPVFSIYNQVFQKDLVSLTFVKKSFHSYLSSYYFCFLFHEYLFDFLHFHTSSRKKSKNKKIV